MADRRHHGHCVNLLGLLGLLRGSGGQLGLLGAATDRDLLTLRLGALSFRNGQAQHTLVNIGSDALFFDVLGQPDGAHEAAVGSLELAHTVILLALLSSLLTRNGQHILMELDIDVVLVEARNIELNVKLIFAFHNIHLGIPQVAQLVEITWLLHQLPSLLLCRELAAASLLTLLLPLALLLQEVLVLTTLLEAPERATQVKHVGRHIKGGALELIKHIAKASEAWKHRHVVVVARSRK